MKLAGTFMGLPLYEVADMKGFALVSERHIDPLAGPYREVVHFDPIHTNGHIEVTKVFESELRFAA